MADGSTLGRGLPSPAPAARGTSRTWHAGTSAAAEGPPPDPDLPKPTPAVDEGSPANAGVSGASAADKGAPPDPGLPDAAEAIAALRAAGLGVATAESLTGGLVAAALSAVAGSSAVLHGGVVAYDEAAKRRLLGVPAALLARHGPVHPEVAAWMALGACRGFAAPVAVSATGVAGPDPHGGHPPGVVFIGWRSPVAEGVLAARLADGRAQVRHGTVRLALDLLAQVAAHGCVTAATVDGGNRVSDAGVTIGT